MLKLLLRLRKLWLGLDLKLQRHDGHVASLCRDGVRNENLQPFAEQIL